MDLMQNNTSEVEIFQFTWSDYSFFTLMLAASALIGIYFGCFGKKQSSANEYLLGGKKMTVFPISMSLIASVVNGITLLGVPSDVYRFGTHYVFICLVFFGIGFIMIYAVLPVFYNLQLISVFEYLNLRFNSTVRKISSFLSTVGVLLYLPIILYAPAIAMAQVTGLNLHLITTVACGVCIFYTTIGGLKAVVWTDTLQFVIMIGAIAMITYLGNVASGGFSEVWRISTEGGRTIFDFDLDPTKRDTVWTLIVGLPFTWIYFLCFGQGCVQKCLSLPTITDAKKAYIIFIIGLIIIYMVSVYTGLMMYTTYKDCDPFAMGKVKQFDLLLLYFIMEIAGKMPGLPGIFIAGIFSAALSSLSALMNGLSGTIYEDFLSGYMKKDISQKVVSNILKLIVVVVGIIITGLVFVVAQLETLLPLSISLTSMLIGPLLGVFSMGMLIPKANSNGVTFGLVGSVIIMGWITIGSQYYKVNKIFVYPTLPLSTEGCLEAPNVTLSIESVRTGEEQFVPFFVYRISYYYYGLIGVVLVYLIGIPVSYFTLTDETQVHKDLISPVMHWALPKNTSDKNTPHRDYYSVEDAMEMVNKS